MITVDEIKKIFSEKLDKTGSMDAALTKAVWVAYEIGVKDGIAYQTAKAEEQACK